MDFISGIAGVILSLAFSYIPGAKTWFETLTGDQKRLVMLVTCLIVPLGMIGLSCAGLGADFGLTVACDRAGFVELAKAFGIAAIANQTAYQLSPNIDGATSTLK